MRRIPGWILFLFLLASPSFLGVQADVLDGSSLLPDRQAESLPELPKSSPWSLRLPLGFPQGLGAELQFQTAPWFSFTGFYHLPTQLRIQTRLKSRKLVEREGILIRSPEINLPFHVQMGPHAGLGCRLWPFLTDFYLMFALESRLLKIDSIAQSHLEVIDSQSKSLTNTLFRVSASTRTEQRLLQSTVGYRWSLGTASYFVTAFSGFSRPLWAQSSIKTDVRVLNLEASNPDESNASNLRDAEVQQGRVVHQKLATELRKFERMSLPILGISFGKDL